VQRQSADAGKALLPETRKPHPWGSTAASLRQTVSGNNTFLRLRALVGIIMDAALHRLRAHCVQQCSTAASLRQAVSGDNNFRRLRALVGIIRDAAFHCSPLVFQR